MNMMNKKKKKKKTKKKNNNDNNNDVKGYKIKKEKSDEKDENAAPIEYHYFLINNFYCRYKCYNVKKKIQQYYCCVAECNGMGELNIEEKEFYVIKKHSISVKNHPNFNDDKPVKFMRNRKLQQLHIKKNDDNKNYHLEWFK